jgi:hypothetical protein
MSYGEADIGFELITDTLAHTGRFFRLYALEATVQRGAAASRR